MDIFISWSGDRSKTVATALRLFLRQTLQAVNPWLSTEIIAGTRWGPDIGDKLESIDFGVLCLTDENKNEPWILFEAGAISKKGRARVIPFLLGMAHDDIDYPLRQFNCCPVSKEGAKSVVNSLNHALGDERLAPDILEMLFAKLWPEFETTIKTIPDKQPDPKPVLPVENQLAEMVKRLTAIETRMIYKAPPAPELLGVIGRAMYNPSPELLKMTAREREDANFQQAQGILFDLQARIRDLMSTTAPAEFLDWSNRLDGLSDQLEALRELKNG